MYETENNFELLRELRDKIRGHKPCNGYGYLKNKDKVVMCECRKQAAYEFRLSNSGIPHKYKTKGFKDYAYPHSEAYKKVRAYLDNADQYRKDGIGLFLFGPSYTGKSLLACSLLMGLMKRGFDCKFSYFSAMLEERDNRARSFLASNWDFVVLDGVGDVLNSLTNFRAANLTGEKMHGAAEFLGQFLSRRVHFGKPIIITSTVDLPNINEHFPSVAAPLIGNCFHVSCEDKGFKQRRLNDMMSD